MGKSDKKFKKSELYQLVKYGLFGAITTAINLLLFYLFEKTGMYYLLSNTISYFIAVIINYVFNDKFVFDSSSKFKNWNWNQFIKFFSIRFISLLIDNFLFYIAVDIIHLNVYFARITLSALVILLTFFVNKIFVFNRKEV